MSKSFPERAPPASRLAPASAAIPRSAGIAPDATGVVLILQPAGEEEGEDLRVIHNCLRTAGFRAVESPADALPRDEFSALLIRGSIGVRGYLNPERSSDELLDPRVAKIIRGFFHSGKPIAAPCMGLAVVMEALSSLLSDPLILSPGPECRAIAVYPALRLVTTSRPLIGRSPDEIASALTQVMSELRRLLLAC
jgi:enhancing lycopene biosynthesis protein 2